MKKFVVLSALLFSIASLPVNAVADDYSEVGLLIAGETIKTDQPAVIVNGRTMVPIRVIAEALKCSVDWDADTKTVTFQQSGITAKMVIGEKVLILNDGTTDYSVEIDTPAVIINNRTMVPMRFLTENFGFNVEWDNETKTVNIVGDTSVGSTKEDTSDDSVDDDNDDKQYEGMADRELKDYGSELDSYIAVLNDNTSKMTEEQAKKYDTACNSVAKTMAMLDTGKYTAEEITAGNKALTEAEKTLKEIADSLKVDLSKTDDDDTETTETYNKESVKLYAEGLDKGIAVLNKITDKFSADEKTAYDKDCDAVATVLKEVTSDMTQEELKGAVKALDSALDSFKTLADKYNVSDDFEKEYTPDSPED